MIIRLLVTLLLASVFCAPTFVHAADRVALVIGNKDYEISPLNNPVNDARDMGQALRQLGFSVQEVENGTKQQMDAVLNEFTQRSRKARIALLYYSGHGQQYQGANYMIPVGAMRKIQVAGDIEYAAIAVERIIARLDNLAPNSQKLIILDACRDNKLPSETRSGSSGLAATWAPQGTLIAFATKPGGVSFDGGRGRNGIFTKHLLRCIRTPNKSFNDILMATRKGVYRETDGAQQPWDHSSLLDPVYLTGSAGSTASASPVPVVPQYGRLFVETRPENATVKVMNIKEKYYPGIALKQGRYLIRVQADGYLTKDEWASVDADRDNGYAVTLKESSRKAVSAGALRTQTEYLSCDGVWRDSPRYSSDEQAKTLYSGTKVLAKGVDTYVVSPDKKRIVILQRMYQLNNQFLGCGVHPVGYVISFTNVDGSNGVDYPIECSRHYVLHNVQWTSNDTIRFYMESAFDYDISFAGRQFKSKQVSQVRIDDANYVQ